MTSSEPVAVVGSRKLTGDGWTLTAERPVERSPHPWEPGEWVAVLGVRRDLKVLVTGDDPDQLVRVEAWAGEPGDETDGVAVIQTKAGELALARVLLCGCGDRGCGNCYCQLDKYLAADELPALLARLRELPWADPMRPPAARDAVLRGDDLLALPDPEPLPPGSYALSSAGFDETYRFLVRADGDVVEQGDEDP
jgi:hypothetical protein